MIQVRVLLFAGLRDRIGKGDFSLNLNNGSTLEKLTEEIFPDLEDRQVYLGTITYAINYEEATLDIPLQDGDEVALLPPMSGG